MSPSMAFIQGIRQVFDYAGRVGRAEFWWFAGPWMALAFLVIWFAALNLQTSIALQYWMIASFVLVAPLVTAAMRRVNDAGLSNSYPLLGGCGLSAMIAAPLMYVLTNVYPDSHSMDSLFIPIILATVLGLIAFIFAVSAPSQPT